VRALVELDQAILQLLRLAAGDGESGGDLAADEAPRSLREGLSLLQVRVRNLQHSLGLEAIPAHDRPFDDRWHEARGVARRPDLPDGWVVEEILPGYRLGERVVRPARVVVNRRS
jgi:molecular chaperone GrpE